MADMPTRQKILLIALVIVLSYYVYTLISGDDSGLSLVQPPPVTRQPVQRQTPWQTETRRQPMQQRPVRQETQEKVKAAFALEWQNDPFYRKKKSAESVTDTASQPSRLAELKFTGFFDRGDKTLITINENWYEIGDFIDGMEIIEIEKNNRYVVLKENGTTYKLYLTR